MEYDAFEGHLKSRFPEMFSQPYGGIAVGPGWWPLLERTCSEIQHWINYKNKQKDEYGRGEGCPQVYVTQIKEKFGTLRFYYDGGDDHVHGIVTLAESISGILCEECGSPGKIRTGGWVRTLCDHHEEERQAKQKERGK